MIIEEEVYLEHYGTRGMRWGVRTAKTIGSGAATGAKAIGRGTKATFNWSRAHPRTAASIAVGAALAGVILSRKISSVNSARNSSRLVSELKTEHMKKLTQAGSAWRKNNGPWHYAIPSVASKMSPANKELMRNVPKVSSKFKRSLGGG